MIVPPAIGSCFVFPQGYGDFCAGRRYAIAAIQEADYLLVEINFRDPSVARYVRRLKRAVCPSLLQEGLALIEILPQMPAAVRALHARGIEEYWKQEADTDDPINRRIRKLRPLIEMRQEILSAADPSKQCNEIARRFKLNITRTRAQFFWLACYEFEPSALAPAYWNSGPQSEVATACEQHAPKKRGRKVMNPSVTAPGWAFDYENWPSKIMAGWRAHARPGKSYQHVYALTLHHQFKCIVDMSMSQVQVFQPQGDSFPSRKQFSNYVIAQIGKAAWQAAKFGDQTIRNRTTSSAKTIAEHLVNLLEEVQWDGQILDEIPGDVRDPTQPGKPIVKVNAICGTCGGPCGVGYDYGSESKWGYLMALLSMAMKKSDFGALFGLDISDEDWPAYGIMAAIRGDRGPAIGRPVTEIVGEVLGVWQEWAASYDPIGKANAEAGHYKAMKVEGKPQRSVVFRSPMEIIRDDLRRTVAKFRSADMSHRLDPEQARRLPVGTPRTIWNDLVKRGLYAG